MSTSELVRRWWCSQTVDGEEGPCKRQKLGTSINGELLSSLINDINAVSRIRLQKWFPALAMAHETNDWSLQLKCFDPDLNGSNWDIKDAFSSEFVALCVWLLFTKHSKINKNDVLGVLQTVKSSFSVDPHMSNDPQPDKIIEEDILVDVLCLDSREVQEQVCCALAFSVSCYRNIMELTFGDGIQYKLFQVIDNPRSKDSNVICALRAIAILAGIKSGMQEKIIEAEIDNFWLAKIMMTENKLIMVEACWTLHFVVTGKDNEIFWRHTLDEFIPALVRWSHIEDRLLKQAALCAILTVTTGASAKQIESLVEKGCLKALFQFACGLMDFPAFELFLNGVWNILRTEEEEEEEEEDDDDDDYDYGVLIRCNKYAKMIDDFRPGWALLSPHAHFFCNNSIEFKAEELLRKYCPKYLEKLW